MSERITKRHLVAQMDNINNALGYTGQLWQTIDGRNIATVGMLALDGAYGGWRVERMSNTGGGVSFVGHSYRMTARECYYMLRGMYDVLFIAREARS